MLHSGDSKINTLAIPALEPQIALPDDEGLPDISLLFDSQWVWQTLCGQLGMPDEAPEEFRVTRLSYRPGHRATASYEVRWPEDMWLPDDRFAIGLAKDKPLEVYSYPDDPYLPGLPQASSALEAADLLIKKSISILEA